MAQIPAGFPTHGGFPISKIKHFPFASAQRQRCRGNVSGAKGPIQRASPQGHEWGDDIDMWILDDPSLILSLDSNWRLLGVRDGTWVTFAIQNSWNDEGYGQQIG